MTNKVLIVDDDNLVRNALQRCLRGAEYKVDVASSSSEAFEKLTAEQYAVVVSDLKMPRIDGMALLRWIAENQPNVRRILLTGHADLEAVVNAVNEAAVYRIIQKPWNDTELRIIVESAINEHGAVSHAAS
jgi:DNA-binding NtrC family response regulator